MIDSHCHLTDKKFASDLEDVVDRAKQTGLDACVTIGTGIDDARHARELSRRFESMVHCAAGLDPFTCNELGPRYPEGLVSLATLLTEGGFVALGEVGLDYHYDLAPCQVQRKQLVDQLELAQQMDLPVVIHVREAHEDMAAVLAAHPEVTGVIHSFTGTEQDAWAYVELGWHIAFNGIVTFANADSLRSAAKVVPEDKLLVETDSPYLAPVPRRGKRCEPAFVQHTVACLADVRQTTSDRLAGLTADNARRLFRIP